MDIDDLVLEAPDDVRRQDFHEAREHQEIDLIFLEHPEQFFFRDRPFIPVDQHELAQVAGTDAQRGTNSGDMEDALKKIDNKFKVNYKPLAYRLRSGGMGVPS